MNQQEKKKQVAIYCRVSTVEQAEEGYSIGEQERLIREYCMKQGYEVLVGAVGSSLLGQGCELFGGVALAGYFPHQMGIGGLHVQLVDVQAGVGLTVSVTEGVEGHVGLSVARVLPTVIVGRGGVGPVARPNHVAVYAGHSPGHVIGHGLNAVVGSPGLS